MNKGSKLDMRMSGLDQPVVAFITDNDGKSMFAAKSSQGQIDFIYIHKLSKTNQGTRVDVDCQINAHATLHLAEVALQEATDERNTEDLSLLKQVLESNKTDFTLN